MTWDHRLNPWPDLSCVSVCPQLLPRGSLGKGMFLNVTGINKPGATWVQTRELFQG